MNPVGVTRADNLHGKFRNSVAEFFCVYRCVESLLSKAPEGTKRKLCRLCLHNFPCKIVCRDPVSGRAAPRAANPVGVTKKRSTKKGRPLFYERSSAAATACRIAAHPLGGIIILFADNHYSKSFGETTPSRRPSRAHCSPNDLAQGLPVCFPVFPMCHIRKKIGLPRTFSS